MVPSCSCEARVSKQEIVLKYLSLVAHEKVDTAILSLVVQEKIEGVICSLIVKRDLIVEARGSEGAAILSAPSGN